MGRYKRNHHNLIDDVLRRLDNDVLNKYKCYSAEGTAIALRYVKQGSQYNILKYELINMQSEQRF